MGNSDGSFTIQEHNTLILTIISAKINKLPTKPNPYLLVSFPYAEIESSSSIQYNTYDPIFNFIVRIPVKMTIDEIDNMMKDYVMVYVIDGNVYITVIVIIIVIVIG